MVTRGGLLRDQVYDLITGDMKSSFLVPGQRVPELTLAERYGVSRTPVREALIKLQREGLVEAVGRGYVVLETTGEELVDRLFVRRLLDPEVARRAALDGDEAQIKSLQQALQAQIAAHKANDHQSFVEANQSFRQLLTQMCRNATLARCASLVDEQFRVSRAKIYEDANARAKTIRHERRLMRAVAARDANEAANVVNEFLAILIAEATKLTSSTRR